MECQYTALFVVNLVGTPHDYYHYDFNFILIMNAMWDPTNNAKEVLCIAVALHHTWFLNLV